MKKENKIREIALKGVSKSLESGAKKEVESWPPICGLLLHQPKRPESRR